MIARIAWWSVLLAVAVVTIGVQLDRQTRRTSQMAQSVPEAFRSAAQLPVAAYALAGEDPERALAEAEKLVRRRPLPAEHLRILAQAQVAAGAVNEGTLTIQYAAQRGWRDPLAQESMLRLALSAGDSAEAARRYAALFLRRDTEDALLEELGPQVLSESGGDGRATLIAIVSGGDRWHSQFLNRGSRLMPPAAFVEIVEGAIAEGTRFDCPALRQSTRAVIARNEEIGLGFENLVNKQC